MSTTDFGNLDVDYIRGNWKLRVGFLGHGNIIHLWDAERGCWLPAKQVALPVTPEVPLSEAAQ